MPAPDVVAYIRGALPAPPARVLEIGAGDGTLAAALRDGGYDVVAIDPEVLAPDARARERHERDRLVHQAALDGDERRLVGLPVEVDVLEPAELVALAVDDLVAAPVCDVLDGDHGL